MTSASKTKFRRTRAWIEFRIGLIETRGKRCEMCGVVKRTARELDCHHLHPEDYANLDPDRFKILCTGCHDFVERMALRVLGRDPFPNRTEFLRWAGPFLPTVERKYGLTKLTNKPTIETDKP